MKTSEISAALLVERHFIAMGTLVSVKIALESRKQIVDAEAATAEAEKSMNFFGHAWWAWGSGELAGINRRMVNGDIVEIPNCMQFLFARAWEIRQITEGKFEPRIAALVRLWGFDDVARLRTTPPDQADIDALLAAMHAAPPYEGGNSYGPAPGVAWDFGAIGKGYIVDATLDVLHARGFPNAMVDAGGNLAMRGTRSGQPWRVGIRDPRSNADAPRIVVSFDTSDEAVITHGDDQRFFEWAGRRYSHILDPATGSPVHGLRSLTVAHPNGTLADAEGSALFAAGADGWRQLAQKLGLHQVLVITDDGTVQATAALAARVQPHHDTRIEVVH